MRVAQDLTQQIYANFSAATVRIRNFDGSVSALGHELVVATANWPLVAEIPELPYEVGS
jgi:hypothetical protein